MTSVRTAKDRRVVALFLTAALGVALVGFLTGTRSTPEPAGYRAAPPTAGLESGRAPRQRDMEAARYARRHAEQSTAFAGMSKPPRTALDPVTRDPRAYAQAVAQRAEGRAYDGAPPTIPHAVDQRGAPACLACHAEGLRVGERIAKPLSHPPFGSCLQCHTTREAALVPAEPLPPSVAESTSFVGLSASGPGPRAWPGAPPQMPHKSFMRERCASCHGVWADGLASTHAARASCNQCHAPSAEADQTPRSLTLVDTPRKEAP